MKKYALTLIFAIVCASGLKAQTEFAPLGATWYYSVADEYGDPLSDYEKYVSIADTLINGKSCHIVASASDTLIFYNDNGKVYNWFCGHFLLTYDFRTQAGDTVTIDFRANKSNSITIDTFYTVQCVVKVDTLADSNLKHFELDMIPRSDLPDYHFGRYSYVENVGYEAEPMYILTNLVSPDITIGTCYLRCYNDNTISYKSSWWKSQNKDCDYKETGSAVIEKSGMGINMLPNPVDNQLIVTFEYAENIVLELRVFSEQGIMVQKNLIQQCENSVDVSSLSKGLYYVAVFNEKECISTIKMIKL